VGQEIQKKFYFGKGLHMSEKIIKKPGRKKPAGYRGCDMPGAIR
jgi:hypothetical protein